MPSGEEGVPCAMISTPIFTADPLLPSSWTTRTTAASTSGSVAGSTPCPRLKMCPGRARFGEHFASRLDGELLAAETARRVQVALHRLVAHATASVV